MLHGMRRLVAVHGMHRIVHELQLSMIGESLGVTKKSYRGRYRWTEATQNCLHGCRMRADSRHHA